MRNALVAAAAALAGMSVSAHAADVYGGSTKDAPVAYDAPTPVWAGLYVGGSVGFGVGDTSGELNVLPEILNSEYDVNGTIYGAHLGYNMQRGNVVYGVELGLNGSDIDGNDTCVFVFECSRELDWYATAVGRLGYASGRSLFYGFGGVAWGEVKTDVSLFGVVPIFEGEETHVGWTAGLGIEHAFSDRFIGRIEYSHVDLGEEDHSFGNGLSSNVDLTFNAIKVGGSYKLSGDRAPLDSYK